MNCQSHTEKKKIRNQNNLCFVRWHASLSRILLELGPILSLILLHMITALVWIEPKVEADKPSFDPSVSNCPNISVLYIFIISMILTFNFCILGSIFSRKCESIAQDYRLGLIGAPTHFQTFRSVPDSSGINNNSSGKTGPMADYDLIPIDRSRYLL